MTLLGAWPLDEGTGTTAEDVTGNGGDLTLDAATWATPGHDTHATALTNTTGDAGASGTVPAITTPGVTLMAWVKPLDLASGSSHAAVGVFQGGGSTDIALFTQRGDFGSSNVVQADVRIDGNLTACNGTGPLTVGTWTHVAVTYDGSNIRLYRNAVLEATVFNDGAVSLGTAFYAAGALAAAGIDSDVEVNDARYLDEVLDGTAIAALKDIPVEGETTITGSGGGAAPPASGSGAGSVAVSGSGGGAAPPATGSGAAVALVSGSGAGSAPFGVGAGTGALLVAGSGGASAPPVTGEGSGGVLVSGSGAGAAPAAQGSGTGVLESATIIGSGGGSAPLAIGSGHGFVGEHQDFDGTLGAASPRQALGAATSRWRLTAASLESGG